MDSSTTTSDADPQAFTACVDLVRAFVSRALAREIDDEDNYFLKGFVTSMFGLQLITFIENTYELEITDDDLVVDNFNSVANVATFISRKQNLR